MYGNPGPGTDSGMFIYSRGTGPPVADHWERVNGREIDEVDPSTIPASAFKRGAGSINRFAFWTDLQGSELKLNGRVVLAWPRSGSRPISGRMRLCVGILNDENEDYRIRYSGLTSQTSSGGSTPTAVQEATSTPRPTATPIPTRVPTATSTPRPTATPIPTRVPTATPQPRWQGSPTALHELLGHERSIVSVDQVRLLVAEGAPLNTLDSLGRTVLEVAASRAHSSGVLSELISGGADPGRSSTVLHQLLDRDRWYVTVDQVRVLVSAGAPLNSTDRHGRTVLEVAASRAHSSGVLTELISGGADPRRSPTILHELLGRNRTFVTVGQVRILLDAGASLTTLDDQGRTPLDVAASRGHSQEIMQLLVP